jgi:hypothetical protein
MRLPRMTIRRWMIAVGFVALGLVQAQLATFLLILTLAAVALRYCSKPAAQTSSRKWAIAFLVTLACLYLPYIWLLLIDYPWDSYQWGWIKLWPVLPGLLAGVFFHPNDAAVTTVSAAAAILLLGLFTWVGSFGRTALILSNALVLIGAIFESWFAYKIFLL